jgi:hypothetical protein
LSKRKRQDLEELDEQWGADLSDTFLALVGLALERDNAQFTEGVFTGYKEGLREGLQRGRAEGKRLAKGKAAEAKPRGRPKDPKSDVGELLGYFVKSEREKNGTTIKHEVTRFLELMQ